MPWLPPRGFGSLGFGESRHRSFNSNNRNSYFTEGVLCGENKFREGLPRYCPQDGNPDLLNTRDKINLKKAMITPFPIPIFLA